MSLVFHTKGESGLVGAPQVGLRLVSPPHLSSSERICEPVSAERRGFRARMSRGEAELRTQFDRVSTLAGLTEDECAKLAGATWRLPRVILALETVLAAIDLLGSPAVAAAWLRWDFAETVNHVKL